jgi:tetratricopeptide (TPR) repeat protein
VVFCASVAAAAAQQQDTADEYLRRGNANLRRGDLVGAAANYDKSLELNPRSAEAHFKRGQVRRTLGDLDGAIEDYEFALDIDATLVVTRDVAEAYYKRGFIKANGLELDNAISDFSLAIRFNPKDPNTFIKRGESHLVLQDLDQAVADFESVIELGADNTVLAVAYVDRGYARMLQGKAKEARADFTKGVQTNPERRFLLELHLRMIEAQTREMKRRQETSVTPVAVVARDQTSPAS